MLRLNDIAEQRNIYSSVDDIGIQLSNRIIKECFLSVYAHDSDSDFDEPYENRFKVEVPCSIVKTENCSPEESLTKIIRPWSVETENVDSCSLLSQPGGA